MSRGVPLNASQLSFFLPLITVQVTRIISERRGWSEDTAFERLVESDLYAQLEDPETGMWRYSPLLLAMMFDAETDLGQEFPDVAMDGSMLAFKAYCVDHYKLRHNITGREALSIFREYGVIWFLDRHYEVLHQLSMDCIIDEFIAVRSRGLKGTTCPGEKGG